VSRQVAEAARKLLAVQFVARPVIYRTGVEERKKREAAVHGVVGAG
jgi:hypothetical protein